jgi:Uncharacterised nucleotidyltransferase
VLLEDLSSAPPSEHGAARMMRVKDRPKADMPATELWQRVDRLLDRAPGFSGLRAHRLHLLAARRWHALGRPLPEEVLREERLAALKVMTAPLALERIREACDGQLILIKGLEVAARYPDPLLRPFIDIDLLVPDAEEVQRALVGAGFTPMVAAEHVAEYHLAPLKVPDLPLRVEIHRKPRWIRLLEAPREELFSVAVPSRSGVAGIDALPAPHHAMLLAAHSWAHEPLRRALDLVDIAVLCEGHQEQELRTLARFYGLERVWRATEAACRALLEDGRRPWSLRLWARNLAQLRERTVFEFHLARWLSDFWAVPPERAAAGLASALAKELLPAPGETWKAKLGRARIAFRNAATARSEHERELHATGSGDPRAAQTFD